MDQRESAPVSYGDERLRTFGARVRGLRMERGFRVVDVARALSCDTSSIYGFERGGLGLTNDECCA